MHRSILYLVVLPLLIALIIFGYIQSAPPTPPPATPAPPTATLLPTALPTATPAPLPTAAVIRLSPFILTLPAAWFVLQPNEPDWTARLQSIATQQPLLAQYLTTLAPPIANHAQLVLTWPPTATADFRLIAAVLQSDGLTLQSYLAAATEELAQSRLLLGNALTVQHAAMRYDLRPDHLPVATLHYTLPATPSAATTGTSNIGYQVAMLDSTGRFLLLLTAVSHDPNPTQMLAQLEAIVAAVKEE